jgi:tagatose-1,6-bisphosphate aldolase
MSLDRIADSTGRFAILAMDQRGTLRTMLERAGRPAADTDLGAFKVDVVSALAGQASAVLLDVEYGTGSMAAIGGRAGLLVTTDRPEVADTHGGGALKTLVRWRSHPTGEAVDEVRAVVAGCRAYGLPSVVEALVADRSDGGSVIRSAEILAGLGPDLLKLEWPGDAAGCRRLSEVCGSVPWTLLSAGVAYDEFAGRVLAAMDAGASGYIAGRAFWGEAAALDPAGRREFLRTTAVDRMRRLNAATAGRGRSWQEVAG